MFRFRGLRHIAAAFPVFCESPMRQDPNTKISLPDSLKESQLLGLGVRSVTFLGIYVYVVGLYISTESTEKSINLEDFVMKKKSATLYITPVRKTSLSHLRDGFIKILGKSDENLINQFRGIFPNVSIEKGHVLMLEREENILHIYLNGSKLGTIESREIADCLFKAYLTEKAVSKRAYISFEKGRAQMENKI